MTVRTGQLILFPGTELPGTLNIVIFRQQRCPNCRSLLLWKGVISPAAPALQSAYCWVCNQQLFISSGLLPRKWTIARVLEKGPQPIPPPAREPEELPDIRVWDFWPEEDKFWYQRAVETIKKIPWSKVALYGVLIVAGIIVIKTATRKILE